MSLKNNSLENLEEQKNEKLLYRPQIWRYRYQTCLEKPYNLKDSYDPDTMNSLRNLIKSTSIDFSNSFRYLLSLSVINSCPLPE